MLMREPWLPDYWLSIDGRRVGQIKQIGEISAAHGVIDCGALNILLAASSRIEVQKGLNFTIESVTDRIRWNFLADIKDVTSHERTSDVVIRVAVMSELVTQNQP